MALPIAESVEHCCLFKDTVEPYLPKLYELPYQILSLNNPTDLKDIYLTTNPLISGLAVSLILAFVFFVISEINGNFSQIDRFWSILPSFYNAHFFIFAKFNGLHTKRLETVLLVSTLWSIRLTFNFYRKGGYSKGSEDYRWDILRKKISPPLFVVFNIVFVSFAQSVLLFIITAPTYIILIAAQYDKKISMADIIFASTLMALIAIEFVADQQQWNYQEAKRKYLETAKVPSDYTQEDLDRGFIVRGLWSKSRHPNFVAEQAIWITFYLWACWTSQQLFNWSSVGVIAYLALFQGSTNFTEQITAGKYREYIEYQKKVGRFLPIFSTQVKGAFSEKKNHKIS